MTQATPTIGANKSGVQYRTEDNDGKKALLNHHKGAAAPTYAEAGIVWLDDTATPWLFKIYDGTDWISMASVNAATNVVETFHGTAGLRILNHAADTGAANAYAVAPSPAVTAYATGQIVTLKPANGNTGASTIAVNGLAAKNIKILAGADPSANMMVTTGVYTLVYDGTNFVLLNPSLGSAAYLTAGTAANNLVQLDGSAKLPAVDGSALTNLSAGAQQFVLLATATASSSASLDFASQITSPYDFYYFYFKDILPATSNVSLAFRMSYNNGSSYISGANTYQGQYHRNANASTTSTATSINGTSCIIAASLNNASPDARSNGCLILENPLSASYIKRATWNYFNQLDTAEYAGSGGLLTASDEAVNAIQFFMSSGNIASGKIYMYGVKNT